MHESDSSTGALAHRIEAAAAALSVSVDTFERHVKPHVPCVRLGTVRLYPVRGLAAWLDAQAESPTRELQRRRQEASG